MISIVIISPVMQKHTKRFLMGEEREEEGVELE